MTLALRPTEQSSRTLCGSCLRARCRRSLAGRGGGACSRSESPPPWRCGGPAVPRSRRRTYPVPRRSAAREIPGPGRAGLAREARLALVLFLALLLGTRLGGACRPGHEHGAGDHQSEGGEPEDGLERAVAQALAEDDDAA